MESIGNRLREAREAKGLSVDDAAHQTRIQPILIGGLENDDYSNFPSTTYAKSFLSLYSKFLEVDASEALAQFSGGDAISLSGQGYLEAVTDNIEPRRPSSPYATQRSSSSSQSRRRQSPANSPGLAPVFLGLVVIALVIAIPTLWILGKDANSFDEAVTKGKELTNAAANLSTTEPGGEKTETQPAEEVDQGEAKQGPPTPPAETEPVKTKTEAPKAGETKMAHVASSKTEGILKATPGTVKPGTKPNQLTGNAAAPSVQATPVTDEKPTTGPATGTTSSGTPPAGAATQEPLRAVPLIARPLTLPEDGEPGVSEDPEETPEDESEDPDVRSGGNQFPRPVE